MHYLADTHTLTADGIITAAQAKEIELRSRSAMVALAINAILCAGILAATLGLVFWLADPMAVAVFGSLALVLGLVVLARGGELYRMFGNATALIGAGMLMAGAGIELVSNYPAQAGTIMLIGGAVVALTALAGFMRGGGTTRFALGAVVLMGGALHLAGLFFHLDQTAASGWIIPCAHLYTFALILGTGVLLDLRLMSALAIVPFAQMLETGTFYTDAAYVFISPEPTLTILQMGLLIGVALWAQSRVPARVGRQLGMLAVMAFIVANLAFLVGSLWGDVVGDDLWGPAYQAAADYDAYTKAQAAFRATTLVISADVFSLIWAVLLIGAVVWAAHANRRGLFNGALTFAAIHAYTQLFESFGDDPLAWVIGGLAAVPLAWGIWRLNDWIRDREADVPA